jgi:hypothetical protein
MLITIINIIFIKCEKNWHIQINVARQEWAVPQLLTAVACVRSQVRSCAICEQNGIGAGFLPVLQFPLTILIPPNAIFLSSSGVGTVGHLLPNYQRTQSYHTCRWRWYSGGTGGNSSNSSIEHHTQYRRPTVKEHDHHWDSQQDFNSLNFFY